MIPFLARIALDHKLRRIICLSANAIQRVRHVFSLWHDMTSSAAWSLARESFIDCKYGRHVDFADFAEIKMLIEQRLKYHGEKASSRWNPKSIGDDLLEWSNGKVCKSLNKNLSQSGPKKKKSLMPRLLILLVAIARLRMTPKYAFIHTS